jgi:hypothetical protein
MTKPAQMSMTDVQELLHFVFRIYCDILRNVLGPFLAQRTVNVGFQQALQ